MSETASDGTGPEEEISVPFERVVGLVRQLTHDFRNGLNTLDLQAAFLQELVTDPEVVPEVKRIRGMVSSTAKTLQAFSATFWIGEAHCVTYSAKIFVEDFRARLAATLPEGAPEIAWTEELGDEDVSIDIELIFRAFSEFFKNAVQFREKDREISAHASTAGGRFILEIREGKSSVPSPPETWGAKPLISTRRGAFGMGLFHARRILAGHGAIAEATFDPAAQLLTTRISLPLAAA